MFFKKLKVLTYPNSDILRQIAEPITEVTVDISILANQMMVVLKKKGGIGLAAPQIGKSIRLIAVDTTGTEISQDAFKGFMVNPVVIESDGDFTYLEGCLSVPRTGGWVTRPDNITVEYTNLQGHRLKRNFRGITSTCIQHEIDHLNGILFIDKATEILSKDTVNEK